MWHKCFAPSPASLYLLNLWNDQDTYCSNYSVEAYDKLVEMVQNLLEVSSRCSVHIGASETIFHKKNLFQIGLHRAARRLWYIYIYTPISAEHSLSHRKQRPEYLWDFSQLWSPNNYDLFLLLMVCPTLGFIITHMSKLLSLFVFFFLLFSCQRLSTCPGHKEAKLKGTFLPHLLTWL